MAAKQSFHFSVMQNQPDDGPVYAEVNTRKENFDVIENSCYAATNSRVSSAVKPRKTTSGNKVKVILLTVVAALLVCTAGACIAFTMEIIKLQYATAKLSQDIATLKFDQEQIIHNSTIKFQHYETLLQNLQQESAQNISDTVALYQSLSRNHSSLRETLENLQNMLNQRVNDLESLQGLFSLLPSPSCAALLPSSPSGYYWVTASNGSAVRVYCDMTRSCGGITGGWTRVIELDMRNSSHQCPSGLRQRTFSSTRTCARNTDPAGCSAVFISVTSQYLNICGKITAYQLGSPDAFRGRYGVNVSGNYVDGISLTYGSPKQHIWSFAAGLDEVGTVAQYNCACTNSNLANRTRPPPAFVGDDYFCDTTAVTRYRNGLFYHNSLLWDDTGCGPLNTCCSFNNPPWFYKELLEPTTDNIEMRVCADENASTNEDVLIEAIELYIQ
jgi:hypothetical protein